MTKTKKNEILKSENTFENIFSIPLSEDLTVSRDVIERKISSALEGQ